MLNSVTPQTATCQAPLSMGFSRQEYWGGLLFPYFSESSWPRDQTCISCVSCIGRQIFESFGVKWCMSNLNNQHFKRWGEWDLLVTEQYGHPEQVVWVAERSLSSSSGCVALIGRDTSFLLFASFSMCVSELNAQYVPRIQMGYS